MQISKEQPMRPALDDVIDAVNDIGDIEPYITEATNDWLDAHPEATTTVQDNSLTTDKYQDGSVTGSKISNNAITTDKIADGAVPYDKLHEPDLLMVGGAESVTNDAAITREYLYEPVPDGAGDGLALIESVKGNNIVQDGSLLPVRMEGVETVGFNQIDLTKVHGVGRYNPSVGTVFESGTSATATMTGENPCVVNVSSAWGGLSIISDELIPGETYRVEGNLSGSAPRVSIAVLDASYAVTRLLSNYSGGYSISNNFTPTDTERYLVASVSSSKIGTVTLTNFCLHPSDPSRNGTYEPYWSAQRTIPVATYFPQGMRSAGTAYDELTSTEAITRVGVVDLGTLNWELISGGLYFVVRNGLSDAPAKQINTTTVPNAECARYTPSKWNDLTSSSSSVDDAIGVIGAQLALKDTSYITVADLVASLAGVYLFYELATPTTTPIDPPLPLSYRVGAGGTERVMVASGTQSAPPVFVTRYPINLTDLAESIAPRESIIATGNHAIGDLIMLGWTLCKATQVIVTGETIEIGTNVTKTTVAAEIAALS